MPFVGEALAVATVLCWTLSVQFFAAASRQVGSTPVNIIRLSLALLFFSLLLLIRDGSLLPLDFPTSAWLYLALSGVVGFFIGDIFLFKALVELGPRLAMLLHSLAAPTAAVIGWLFLGEHYQFGQWLGILTTLCGVGLVVMERAEREAAGGRRKARAVSWLGVAYGLGAMLGQAGGYVLSKAGMQTPAGYLDAFAATQIRALAAFACFVVLFSVRRRWGNVRQALGNRRAVGYTAIGALIGPFLGVSLSLQVLHYLPTGIAATFLSLVPIAIIPFSIFLHREYVSLRAIAGTCIAIFGIYLLMMS